MPPEPVTALLLALVALLLWPDRMSPAGPRLAAVRAPARVVVHPRERRRRTHALPPVWRRLLVDLAACVGVAVLLGSTAGLCAGAVAAICADRLQRRRSAGPGRFASLADLPLTCDLLAVCLRAGLPLVQSVGSVAGVVADPLGSALAEVAGRYRLGAEPAAAWADAPDELAGMARALVRAGGSGSAIARSLEDLAADERTADRSRIEARVRQAGVWLLGPLAACFLPAFLCLGVVPLVLGIAVGVFG